MKRIIWLKGVIFMLSGLLTCGIWANSPGQLYKGSVNGGASYVTTNPDGSMHMSGAADVFSNLGPGSQGIETDVWYDANGGIHASGTAITQHQQGTLWIRFSLWQVGTWEDGAPKYSGSWTVTGGSENFSGCIGSSGSIYNGWVSTLVPMGMFFNHSFTGTLRNYGPPPVPPPVPQ